MCIQTVWFAVSQSALCVCVTNLSLCQYTYIHGQSCRFILSVSTFLREMSIYASCVYAGAAYQ